MLCSSTGIEIHHTEPTLTHHPAENTPISRSGVVLCPPLSGAISTMSTRGLAGSAVPGLRVRVPFGNRQVTGILMSTASESTVSNVKLKSVAEVLDTDPLFSEPLLALLTWASGYYHHPVGEVLPLGLSPGERRGLAERATGVAALTLTERGRGLPEGAPHRAPKQAALISLLRQGVTPLSVLAESGFSRAIIRTLIDHALVEQAEVTATEAWRIRSVPLAPNDEQYAAIQRIVEDAGQFAVHLLYGVTGSGKTEVYLQTIAACLEREQQALVLLPEIALTRKHWRDLRHVLMPRARAALGMGGAERDGCGRLHAGAPPPLSLVPAPRFLCRLKAWADCCRRGARRCLRAAGRISLFRAGCRH